MDDDDDIDDDGDDDDDDDDADGFLSNQVLTVSSPPMESAIQSFRMSAMMFREKTQTFHATATANVH
jgi:hypothetical protein